MDAVGDKARTNCAGFFRQLMFDAAWLAHQQCCYWSPRDDAKQRALPTREKVEVLSKLEVVQF
jgi:hypothetical protein